MEDEIGGGWYGLAFRLRTQMTAISSSAATQGVIHQATPTPAPISFGQTTVCLRYGGMLTQVSCINSIVRGVRTWTWIRHDAKGSEHRRPTRAH